MTHCPLEPSNPSITRDATVAIVIVIVIISFSLLRSPYSTVDPTTHTRHHPTMSNPNDQPIIPKPDPDVAGHQSEDTATAILRPKKSPNRLIVDEATADDNSVATLNPATMDTLGLFRGDTIIVRGKKRKDTVLICLSSDDIEEGKIALNKGASSILRSLSLSHV